MRTSSAVKHTRLLSFATHDLGLISPIHCVWPRLLLTHDLCCFLQVIFGSLNMDLAASYLGDHDSSGPLDHTFAGTYSAVPGGKGFNQACATALLGASNHYLCHDYHH